MNEQQAENLRTLIRHMETKCNRTLDMSVYHFCGAPACALGEAQAIGLIKSARQEHVEGTVFGFNTDIGCLFSSAIFNPWRRDNVTPQEWAAEARKVLAEHGYSMDDGFAAFKERLLNKPYEEPKWRDNGGLEMLRDYDRAQRGE